MDVASRSLSGCRPEKNASVQNVPSRSRTITSWNGTCKFTLASLVSIVNSAKRDTVTSQIISTTCESSTKEFYSSVISVINALKLWHDWNTTCQCTQVVGTSGVKFVKWVSVSHLSMRRTERNISSLLRSKDYRYAMMQNFNGSPPTCLMLNLYLANLTKINISTCTVSSIIALKSCHYRSYFNQIVF